MKNQGKIIIGSVILYGVATVGFGLSKFFPLSIAFLILVGFGDMEAGFLAKTVGGPASVVIGGVGTVSITGLVAWKSKALRNYHGKDLAV